MLDAEFEAQLQRLGSVCSAYVAEEQKLFEKAWNRQLDISSIKAAGTAVTLDLREKHDRLHEQLRDICTSYIGMNATEREETRNLVGDYPGLPGQLVNHLWWEIAKVTSKADQNLVMRGLAAVSLADLRETDVRDLLMAMGKVYLRAYDVGAFLSLPLARIAEMSNPDPRPPNRGSMREFFLNFEESAYFKTSVEPKLGQTL